MADVLAWIDVETTGLDPHNGDRLLEVACILTDTDLNVLSEPFHYAVYYDYPEIADMMEKADEYVFHMHDDSGLWHRLRSEGIDIRELDASLLEYISEFAPEPRQARVAGNSVRLDLNFIDVFLPKTAAHLHYRFVDVTGISYFLNSQGFTNPSEGGPSAHEALADIQASIEQLREARQQLKAGRAQTTRHTNPPR